jgi:hypothetical protein
VADQVAPAVGTRSEIGHSSLIRFRASRTVIAMKCCNHFWPIYRLGLPRKIKTLLFLLSTLYFPMDYFSQYLPLPQPEYAYHDSVRGFETGTNFESRIWRYMNFTKFLSLLETSSLFFTRADRLGDNWEGALTLAEVIHRKKLEKRNKGKLHAWVPDIIKDTILNTAVSCWHMNHEESAGMWKLYVTGGEGIAICSSIRRLKSCFKPYDGNDKKEKIQNCIEKELLVKIGKVKYINFDSPKAQDIPRILLKRKSFMHEREIRAVVEDGSFQRDPGRPSRFTTGGDYVPVDLNMLIDTIFVSPTAQRWYVELVENVIARYGYHFKVKQSSLDKDPIH